MTQAAPLLSTSIPGFPQYRGKVRDVYDLGDQLLIIATDRLSAFDVVFGDGIPMKGIVLTQLSHWWFERTKHIVANHEITCDVEQFPKTLLPFRDQLAGRSMLVRKTKPLAAEFVVRGYLDGSAYNAYMAEKHVCGIKLLSGLRRRSCFGAPIFTPTTKAAAGHDEPIDFTRLCTIIGPRHATEARDLALELFTHAHNIVIESGLILSDTKFEFGINADGQLILIDEALTPDSSRYWIRETYTPESTAPVSLDKQFVRDYVEQVGWKKEPPAPKLPADVIQQTTERYLKAFQVITGKPLTN
ncbi:phosphoribosylaminoimidazolesuccinocarboxamide synthase [Candidatus Sumerlaeota bacterium]|nr:phosphoribosylaminoimidazolesuccinocarboxamide synthase [Candidatus Sumerlaeota bacterium]